MSTTETSNTANPNQTYTRWRAYKNRSNSNYHNNNINNNNNNNTNTSANNGNKAVRDDNLTPIGPRGSYGRVFQDSTRSPSGPSAQNINASQPPQHPRAGNYQQRRVHSRRYHYGKKAAENSEIAGPSSANEDPVKQGGVKYEPGETELKQHVPQDQELLNHQNKPAPPTQGKKKKHTKNNRKKTGDSTADAALDLSTLSLSVTKHLGTQQVNAKLEGGATVTVMDVPHNIHTIIPESSLDFNPEEIRVSLPSAKPAVSSAEVATPTEPAQDVLHRKTHSALSMAESVISRSPSPFRSPVLLSRDVSMTPPLIDRPAQLEEGSADAADNQQIERKKGGAVILDSSAFNNNKHKSSLYNPSAVQDYYGPQYPAYALPQHYPNDPALYPVSYDTPPALMHYPYMMNGNMMPIHPHPPLVSGPAAFPLNDEDKAMAHDIPSMMMAPSYMSNIAPGPPFAFYPYDPSRTAYNYQYPPSF